MSLQSYLYVVTVGQLNYKPNTFSCLKLYHVMKVQVYLPSGKNNCSFCTFLKLPLRSAPFFDRPSSTILGRRAYQRPNVDTVLGVHWPRSSPGHPTSTGSTRLLLGSSGLPYQPTRMFSTRLEHPTGPISQISSHTIWHVRSILNPMRDVSCFRSCYLPSTP